MSRPDEKRQMRQLKRDLKKAGNRKLRQNLKRQLQENPAEAADAEIDHGRYRSAGLNGMDNDATRKSRKPGNEDPS